MVRLPSCLRSLTLADPICLANVLHILPEMDGLQELIQKTADHS